MRAGLRRLWLAWLTFGVLVAADAVMMASASQGGRLHGFAGTATTCAFVWCMAECYLGKHRETPAAVSMDDEALERFTDRLVHRTTIATIAELHGDRCTLSQPPAERLRAM